ncbi:MAG TPA: alpha/beta hydrolase [Acidimicrobiales bacterium]|nr:alpha/beta hydrolase [Acidimicrobiales bacterium]
MAASDIPIFPNSPLWFQRSIAVEFEDHHVSVDGSDIHYISWGDPGKRGLVFVHGGGAHAHWWTHVAANFANEFRVIALDLSGHGDSDHRVNYSLDQWTQEVMATAKDGSISGAPVIIGHSMGGFVSIATASLHGSQVSGLIICDSPVTEPDPEIGSFHLKEAFGRPRTYKSVEEALAHFRTIPSQENYLDYVMDHVGRRSVKQTDGGWQWKFDRRIFEQFGTGLRSVALPYLSQVHCRIALLRSEFGLVTPDIGKSMYETMGRIAPVIELPEAGHHSMLDQPLVLLTAIRTLLADWDHSEPRYASD